MLTEEQEDLLAGFRERLDRAGYTLRHDRTGVTFRAIIQSIPVLEVDSPIATDLREADIAHIIQTDDPGIKQFDTLTRIDPLTTIEDPAGGVPETLGPSIWEVLDREANTSDFISKFPVKKIVPQDS